MRQESTNPVGQWRRQIYRLSRGRVKEAETGGVQRHPTQSLDKIGGQGVQPPSAPGAVRRVADQRVTQRCEVNANLVGAARLEAALEIRVGGESLERAEAGHRAPAGAGPSHG